MSLLSETVSNVAQGNLDLNTLYVTPQVTDSFTLLNGTFKQAVGFAVPRDQEYTFVIDVNTGLPLELPSGYVPIAFTMKSIEPVPPLASLSLYLTKSLTNPGMDVKGVFDWTGHNINAGTYNETDSKATGLDFAGYQYVTIYSNDFPAPVVTGTIQVVVEYF